MLIKSVGILSVLALVGVPFANGSPVLAPRAYLEHHQACDPGLTWSGNYCVKAKANPVESNLGLTPAGDSSSLRLTIEAVQAIAGGPAKSGKTNSGAGGGDAASGGRNSDGSDTSEGHGNEIRDPCYYKIDTSGSTSAMKGHNPSQGFVTTRYCPANIDIRVNKNFKSRLLYEPGVQTFTPYNTPAPGRPAPPAVPAAPPPPSPEEVAQIAIANLPVPAPTLNMGPGRDTAVVHQPLWLWVDDPGPITATANLVGVQVTATAKLTKTSWNMGEPVGKPGSGKDQQQAVVVCPGAGAPPPAGQDLPDSPADWKPDCGYSYQWRSTIARTGSQSCQWPVTAVTQWTVTWTSNLGVGGTTVLETRNTTGINIAELRTVLVNDPNAQVTTPARPGCY